MIKAQIKLGFIKWSQKTLRVLKIVEVILTIIVTPFFILTQLDTPPEFIVLILTFFGESILYIWILIGFLMSFIFYLLIMYGGLKSYSGILDLNHKNLNFNCKRFNYSVSFNDIILIKYIKNENLKVSWELKLKNSKKLVIKFKNQSDRIKADAFFLENIAKQFNIIIEKEIAEVPFYGHPMGPT